MIPADVSSEESKFVGRWIKPILEIFLGKNAAADFIVRKLAHFSEYAILGMQLSAILVVKNYGKSAYSLYRWSYILLLVLAVAVIDESIQLITPGRSSQVTDILIDTSGGFAGIVLMRLIFYVRTAVSGSKLRLREAGL